MTIRWSITATMATLVCFPPYLSRQWIAFIPGFQAVAELMRPADRGRGGDRSEAGNRSLHPVFLGMGGLAGDQLPDLPAMPGDSLVEPADNAGQLPP